MRFSRDDADVFVPAGGSPEAALARVTHLCVAAHADDIEIMAYAGICDSLEIPGRAFGGVVVTDGAGAPRREPDAERSAADLRIVRRAEQRRAAERGRYAIQIQLAHPSADVKKPPHAGVAADLAAIFGGTRPEVVYLHNPADKHDSHVAVCLRCLTALRALPADRRPSRVLGCEVWRDLDWLVEADKVALDAGRRPEFAVDLLRVFASQISGGKRYALAAPGRRAAHATFHDSHAIDRFTGITWAFDLTPLIADPTLDIAAFTLAAIDRLRDDVQARIARLTG